MRTYAVKVLQPGGIWLELCVARTADALTHVMRSLVSPDITPPLTVQIEPIEVLYGPSEPGGQIVPSD